MEQVQEDCDNKRGQKGTLFQHLQLKHVVEYEVMGRPEKRGGGGCSKVPPISHRTVNFQRCLNVLTGPTSSHNSMRKTLTWTKRPVLPTTGQVVSYQGKDPEQPTGNLGRYSASQYCVCVVLDVSHTHYIKDAETKGLKAAYGSVSLEDSTWLHIVC